MKLKIAVSLQISPLPERWMKVGTPSLAKVNQDVFGVNFTRYCISEGYCVRLKYVKDHLDQVIDSSDVIIHVLDARDPIGTRCKNVEQYLQKEAKHKHLIFVLNKCDLVPTWVTVSK
jgi:nuclear GTP-binding protein